MVTRGKGGKRAIEVQGKFGEVVVLAEELGEVGESEAGTGERLDKYCRHLHLLGLSARVPGYQVSMKSWVVRAPSPCVTAHAPEAPAGCSSNY